MLGPLSILVLLDPAHAVDRWVCADPLTCTHAAACAAAPTECTTTVQAAIAASTSGDVIHLSAETYVEEVDDDAGPDVTIRGEGMDQTAIHGNAGADGVDNV